MSRNFALKTNMVKYGKIWIKIDLRLYHLIITESNNNIHGN
jgi:hypothetical protein